MGWEAWFTLAVIGVTIVALAREFLPPSATVLSAVIVLLVAVALTLAQAFSGFSNPAHQTNLMVYGPGGYGFGDYARLGAPITIAILAAIIALI